MISEPSVDSKRIASDVPPGKFRKTNLRSFPDLAVNRTGAGGGAVGEGPADVALPRRSLRVISRFSAFLTSVFYTDGTR
jgi:hypothetical protein